MNFQNADDAKKVVEQSKTDPEVVQLLHESHSQGGDFIYFAQPKGIRTQYLRMKKKMQQFIPNYFQMGGNFLGMQGMGMPGMGMPPMGMPQMGMPGGPGMGMPGMGMPPMGMPQMGMPVAPGLGMPPMGMQGMPPMQNMPGMNQMQAPVPNVIPTEANKEIKYDIEWLSKNQDEFDSFDKEKKRVILGELMYKNVKAQPNISETQVGQITGMLIDLDILEITEVIEMLLNPEVLEERIKEAIEVIEETLE